MSKKLRNLKKSLTPGDLLPLAVIAFGVIIALTVGETAVSLIGASIAALGAVALIMLLYQRMSAEVDSPYTKPGRREPKYKVTTIKDPDAKRKRIENFEDEEEIKGDEGYRIITRTNRSQEADRKKDSEAKERDTAKKDEKQKSTKTHPELKKDSSKPEKVEEKKPKPEKASPSPAAAAEISSETDNSTQKEEEPRIKDERLYADKIPQVPPKDAIVDEIKNFSKKPLEVPLSILMDSEDVAALEPRREFEYMISRSLMVIASVIDAKTAAYFFVNFEREKLLLESYVSDVSETIADETEFPLGEDIVSQIAKNVKPEILTEINPSAETDLLPYYKKSSGTASFIGVPVFYEKKLVGAIVADTDTPDAYDSGTVGFLGHFTKLFSAYVYNYTEKFDLLQASRTLEAVRRFRSISAGVEFSTLALAEALVDSCSDIFGFAKVGVCMIDDETGIWKIFDIRSGSEDAATLADQTVDLDTTLLGKAITSCKPLIKNEVAEDEIRAHPRESPLTNGFFAAFPILSHTSAYGAIFVEDRTGANLTEFDAQSLDILAKQAGLSVEQLHFLRALTENAMSDPEIGALNEAAFFRRLEEEFARAIDEKSTFSLCFAQIDNYVSFDPEKHADRLEKAVYHVVSIIRKRMKTYDVFGKANSGALGLGLVGVGAEEARLWAERLRSEIAISAVEIGDKRFTVTLSIGLAEFKTEKSLDDAIENAKKALEISLRKTNSVGVFG